MLDQVLVNKLVDALEELYIENRAYKSSLKALAQYLPPAKKVDSVVQAAKADPIVRQGVRRLFASVRSQFPEQAIPVLLGILERNRD